ncbi:MAG: hypothetical protein EBZ89_13220 [Chloroflexi bacterium]|nr:hypothetical protein [Chloroflexota bacterium]
MSRRPKLALVGGGTMAEALIKGLVGRKVHEPGDLLVSDPLPSRLEHLQATYGVVTSLDNRDALAAEAVLVAVKPAQMHGVMTLLAPDWPTSKVGTLVPSLITQFAPARQGRRGPGPAANLSLAIRCTSTPHRC